jgi:hypothetical protein
MSMFPNTITPMSVSGKMIKNAASVKGVPSMRPFPSGAPVKLSAYIATK